MQFENYTDRARGLIQAAQTIALRENHQQFLAEHLLKALLDDQQGLASNLIRAAGGDRQRRHPEAETGWGAGSEQCCRQIEMGLL